MLITKDVRDHILKTMPDASVVVIMRYKGKLYSKGFDISSPDEGMAEKVIRAITPNVLRSLEMIKKINRKKEKKNVR